MMLTSGLLANNLVCPRITPFPPCVCDSISSNSPYGTICFSQMSVIINNVPIYVLSYFFSLFFFLFYERILLLKNASQSSWVSTIPKTDKAKLLVTLWLHTGERTPSLCVTACDGNKILSAGSLTRGESKNHWLPSGLTGRAHQPPFQSANMARKAVYSPVTTCLTCCTLAEAAGH